MNMKKMHPGKATQGIVYAIIAVIALVQIYPIIWVMLSSLKTPTELTNGLSYQLPKGIYFGNYARAFSQSNLLRYLLNSSVVAVVTIVVTIALGAPAAFAIEKLRFRGSGKVMSYLLLGLLVPSFAALLPLFEAFNKIGINNTYLALIIPQMAFNLPMCVYLYAGFMKDIPDSLLEAGWIDGASTWQVFTNIVLPLSRNTTVTVITYNFVFIWNEFVFANTFMTSPEMKTLPIGLNDFVGMFGQTDLGATYSAIVVSMIPTLILYFFLNKQVIAGMAAGAVK
ncbi:carbohydrate ABC transporter permease [Bifidobacterium sp. ESL0769]|uniref:carbohydrate ABC transporter permease n=1 Tax=Bifidobacterium sp. ESL0769 TaxID=2983229 RepID=UPI0023F686DF|nr:carbohydrate ABC transporter permease [Bifidobacterium sp. ESL0769]WEV67037.1 carbohydrate ABC transporter permease [Bifidobacterium sp. ESL0769]